jgi:gliding motility-associated-like protein
MTLNNVLVINYPKFFTPNGDAFNDTWNIFDLRNQINSRIYIFDRFGKLLKELSPKGTGWDGTYTGQPMPADDYWFTVEYSELGITKKFKSHFSLKR